MKTIIPILLISFIVLISGCTNQQTETPTCGDGICEEGENCQEDCNIEVEMNAEISHSGKS